MAKHEHDKIRLLAVYNMISSGRKVTTSQILRELDLKYDIQADRKTIYSDIYAIDRFIPIEATTGRNGGYKKYKFEV